MKAGRKPGSVLRQLRPEGQGWRGRSSVWDRRYRRPRAARLNRDGEVGQPLSLGLAPSRGLPSRHLSMPLVRSYRTLAPLPVPPRGPSAVCFCGTVLTVTRTGRYPASLAVGEPGLSSTGPGTPARRPGSAPIAITSPAFEVRLDPARAGLLGPVPAALISASSQLSPPLNLAALSSAWPWHPPEGPGGCSSAG